MRWAVLGAWVVAVTLAVGGAEEGDPSSASGSDHVVAAGRGADAVSLPPSADLRPRFEQWGLGRSRQGERPTCSVFTVAGAIEFAIGRREGRCPRLSVEFLNWAGNQAAGDQTDGGFFSDLWKGFERYGIATAEKVPYLPTFEAGFQPSAEAIREARCRLDLQLRLHWIKEWNVNTGLSDRQLLDLRRTLHAGWPVCGGFRWPKQERWADGVLQMCSAEAVRDGHSVLLVGYRDDAAQPGGGVLVFRNTSHDGRDGRMPYAYAAAYMNDAAWVEAPPEF